MLGQPCTHSKSINDELRPPISIRSATGKRSNLISPAFVPHHSPCPLRRGGSCTGVMQSPIASYHEAAGPTFAANNPRLKEGCCMNPMHQAFQKFDSLCSHKKLCTIKTHHPSFDPLGLRTGSWRRAFRSQCSGRKTESTGFFQCARDVVLRSPIFGSCQ